MTQMVPHKEKVKTVRDMFEKSRNQIAMALPKHMTTDRMLRVALTEIQKTPRLLECEPVTLVAAVIQAAQLGLEIGVLGQAYLVPFRNSDKNRMEVQLIPGYRGLVQLARRSGEIITFEARCVHALDKFEVAYGLGDAKLVHVPDMTAEDPGAVVAAYAIAKFKDGGYQYEVMSVRQLDAIKRRSKAATSGPWVTDTEEMYRKTVARRLCKWLPASVELASALDLDNKADVGLAQDIEIVGEGGEIIEATATEAPPEKKGALDALAEKLPPPTKPQAVPTPAKEAPVVATLDPDAEGDANENFCNHAETKDTETYRMGRPIHCAVCGVKIQKTLEKAVEPADNPRAAVEQVAKVATATPPRRGRPVTE